MLNNLFLIILRAILLWISFHVVISHMCLCLWMILLKILNLSFRQLFHSIYIILLLILILRKIRLRASSRLISKLLTRLILVLLVWMLVLNLILIYLLVQWLLIILLFLCNKCTLHLMFQLAVWMSGFLISLKSFISSLVNSSWLVSNCLLLSYVLIFNVGERC